MTAHVQRTPTGHPHALGHLPSAPTCYRLDRRTPYPSAHSEGFFSLMAEKNLTASQADEACWELSNLPDYLTPGAVLVVRSEVTGEISRLVLNTAGIF